MTNTYENIEFESEGATLRGRLHKSATPEATLIVMAHGFSATAHMSINALRVTSPRRVITFLPTITVTLELATANRDSLSTSGVKFVATATPSLTY